jgi:predicted phage terminase large subunit-like protein
VVPDNVCTKEQREKIYEFYLSLFDLLEPDGRIVVIGTRYHQDDLYARILEENALHGNWSTFIRSCYNLDGSVLFPEKFSAAQLDDIKKKSYYHFSTQYLNDPIDPENADFKADWIKTYDGTTSHPSSLYLTIDPAISLDRNADYTAMVVAGMFSDRRIRVVDILRRRMVPSDLVDAIFELVEKWRLHRVGIETFAFQKTLKYEIQRQQRERGVFFSIDELGKRHTGHGEAVLSKEARIRRLQPYFEQGLVEIRSDMQEVRDELLSFPRGRHDDLIDALSYQLDYLIPSLARGPVMEEPREVHATPQTYRQVAESVWHRQGGGILDRYFNDLKVRQADPVLTRSGQ